jgi:hypothetical protein
MPQWPRTASANSSADSSALRMEERLTAAHSGWRSGPPGALAPANRPTPRASRRAPENITIPWEVLGEVRGIQIEELLFQAHTECHFQLTSWSHHSKVDPTGRPSKLNIHRSRTGVPSPLDDDPGAGMTVREGPRSWGRDISLQEGGGRTSDSKGEIVSSPPTASEVRCGQSGSSKATSQSSHATLVHDFGSERRARLNRRSFCQRASFSASVMLEYSSS